MPLLDPLTPLFESQTRVSSLRDPHCEPPAPLSTHQHHQHFCDPPTPRFHHQHPLSTHQHLFPALAPRSRPPVTRFDVSRATCTRFRLTGPLFEPLPPFATHRRLVSTHGHPFPAPPPRFQRTTTRFRPAGTPFHLPAPIFSTTTPFLTHQPRFPPTSTHFQHQHPVSDPPPPVSDPFPPTSTHF